MAEDRLLFAFSLTLMAGLSTGIGSLLAFFAKRTSTGFLSASLGFSAGVMIYVSFMDLLPTAFADLQRILSPASARTAMSLAFFGGMGIIAVIDRLVPESENPHEN